MTDQFPPQPEQYGQPGQQPYGQYPPQQPYGYQQPPQPPYPPQQQWQGGPQQPPPRKSHRKRNIWLGVLAAFIVFGIIGSLTGGGTSKDAASTAPAPATPAPAAATTAPDSTAPATNEVPPAEHRYLLNVAEGFPGVTAGPDKIMQGGESICKARRAGGSQGAVTTVVRKEFGSGSARFVRVTERDLCPREIPKKPTVVATFSGSGIENTAKFTVTGDWILEWTYNCSSFGYSGNFIVDEDGGSDFNGASVNELGAGGHGQTHVYDDAGSHYLSMNSECSWTAKVVTG